jgi:arginase
MELVDHNNINYTITKVDDGIVRLEDVFVKNTSQFSQLVCAFYGQGQLLQGVKDGPNHLVNIVTTTFNPKTHFLINPAYENQSSDVPWQEDYLKLYNVLKTIPTYVLLGGDHSVGMSSVASSINKTENVNNLYVLWIDAHADTNTMESSITKNIHGQPLAGIMGYEVPWFPIKETLPTTNLLYFGVRDLDEYEKKVIDKYHIFNTRNTQTMLTKLEEILKHNSEAVFHISFDVDALDSTIMTSTGCVVKDGLFPIDISTVFNFVKPKIIAFDLVEYNPNIGNREVSFNSIKQILEAIK